MSLAFDHTVFAAHWVIYGTVIILFMPIAKDNYPFTLHILVIHMHVGKKGSEKICIFVMSENCSRAKFNTIT